MLVEQGLWTSDSNWVKPLGKDLSGSAQLVLVFGSTNNFKNSVSVIDEARAAYPDAKFIGCSTSGEIHETSVNDNSFAFTAVHFEKTELKSVLVNVADFPDSEAIGKELGSD